MKPRAQILKKTLLSISLCAALSAVAGAQELPSAPHLTLMQRGSRLLSFPKVQRDLGLTSAQTAKVDKVTSWLSARVTSLMQQPKPDEETIKNTDRMASDQLLHLLTPEQTQKLTKLTLQKAGCFALVEPEVATRLKLTSAQVSKIQTVLEDAQTPLINLEEVIVNQTIKEPKRQAAIEKSYDPERARLRKLAEAEEAKALDVLTPAQKKNWLDSIK